MGIRTHAIQFCDRELRSSERHEFTVTCSVSKVFVRESVTARRISSFSGQCLEYWSGHMSVSMCQDGVGVNVRIHMPDLSREIVQGCDPTSVKLESWKTRKSIISDDSNRVCPCLIKKTTE